MVLDVKKVFGDAFLYKMKNVDPTSSSTGAYVSSVSTPSGSLSDVLDSKYPTYSPESRDEIRGKKTYYLA